MYILCKMTFYMESSDSYDNRSIFKCSVLHEKESAFVVHICNECS